MASIPDEPAPAVFPSLEALFDAFTDEDGPPKLVHGLSFMLGVYPVSSDYVHWFVGGSGGLEYQFSTAEFPPDMEILEDCHDA